MSHPIMGTMNLSKIIFVFMGSLLSGAVGAAVIGKDNRIPVPKDSVYAPVGRLESLSMNGAGEREDSRCTATLVGRDILLTAAHCVTDRHNGRPTGAGIRFHAIHFGGSSMVINSTIRIGRPHGPKKNDWALMRIHKPLGDKLG